MDPEFFDVRGTDSEFFDPPMTVASPVMEAALHLVDAPGELATELRTAALKLEQSHRWVRYILTREPPFLWAGQEIHTLVGLLPRPMPKDHHLYRYTWSVCFPPNDPELIPMFQEAQNQRWDVLITYSVAKDQPWLRVFDVQLLEPIV
jgi:hypothetical protein